MSPENQARQRQDWARDLARTDQQLEELMIQLKEKTRFVPNILNAIISWELLQARTDAEEEAGPDCLEGVFR